MGLYLRTQAAAGEFNGSALVARHGQILFSGGFGYANRATARRNDAKTLFRLSGWTVFNELAAHQLRDRGRLDFAASVCRYVPVCPRRWQPITVESLLAGTSGLPDLPRLRADSRLPTIATAVSWMKTQPLVFSATRPGQGQDDSAAPQVLLAYVIGRIGGSGWLNYVQQSILKPAGMSSTFADRDAPAERKAVGYLLPSLKPGRDIEFTSPDPVNGMWSTVGDLFRLDSAISRGKILGPKSREEMLPRGVHTVRGLHGYDRPQGHVADGWFEVFGHHDPDGIFVCLLMNGRKTPYHFYDIELKLAGYASGGATRLTTPVPAPRPPTLAIGGTLGVITLVSVTSAGRAALTTPYAGYGIPAAWSDDGKRLLFNRCGGNDCRAFVVDANGLHEHVVGRGFAFDWTPGGDALLGDLASGRLRSASTKTGAQPLSRTVAGLRGASFTFSPDGTTLLYNKPYGPMNRHARSWLWLVDLTTGRQHRLNTEPGFYRISSQAWSTDGTMIAFERRTNLGSFDGGIYVIGADGSGLRRLATDGGNGPSWSPDGTSLAYNIGISCKIRILHVDGSGSTTLPFEGCDPLWRPTTKRHLQANRG